MATKGIREIAITNDSNYLIEPTLYTTINQTSAATTFTADLDKFELFNGVTVAVKFGVTNNASATLNINGTGAKAIYYEGAAIAASKLKAKHTYVFTYNGTQWELVGDLDTNTQSNYGNITTSGKIGTTADLAVYTTTDGLVTAGTLKTDAPSASGTATAFITSVSQDSKGKISASKANLPTASTSTAGITKVGASGGAAAYSHNHNASDINSGTLNTDRLPDDVVKKRTSLASTTVELDLLKLNPGMYDHTTNPNNLLPTSYGTILNIHGLYKYGALIAAETNNVLYHRAYYYDTDESWEWRGNWQMNAHADAGTAVGNATTPIYITQSGYITAGTAIGASAYHPDSYFVKSITSTDNAIVKFNETSGQIKNSNVIIDDNNNITIPGTIYFSSNTSTSTGKALFAYNSTYPKYGIWYKEGNPDVMAFSASGNADTTTSADFAVEGSGKLYNKGNIIPHTGNATGTVGSTKKPVYLDGGQIKEISYTIEKSVPSDAIFTDHYDWNDITNKPTTLSGYGITDAASSSHSHTLKIGNKSLSVSTSEQEWNMHDILYNTNIIYQSTSWDIITPGIYAVTNSSHDGSGHPGSTTGQTAPYSYGHLIVTRASGYGAAQFYISHRASGSKAANKGIRYRSGWNVDNTNKTEAERWQEWATILDDKNFNLYTPTLTGAGASGSWGISITGTAAKATADASGNTITSTYAPLSSPALTGTPTAPTAANGTNTTQIATTEFVNNTLAYANAMTFKGTLGTGGTITTLPATHNAGDTYRVITAGTWAGKYCEVGTLIICTTDGTAVNDAHWTSVETNEDGAVIGPSSSTTNSLAVFSSATGRVIKDTGTYVKYLDHAPITVGDNTFYQDGLIISGTGKGSANDLKSGLNGVLSWGDAGPQIQFISAGQKGSIIFTEYDVAGLSTSWHFVTDQTNGANVTSTGFTAKKYMTVGQNNITTSYNLYVNGTSSLNGNVTIGGSLIKFTGLGEGLELSQDANYFGTNYDARIISIVDTNPDTGSSTVDGGLIVQAVGRVSNTDTTRELLRIRNHNGVADWRTGEFQWKTKDIVVETGTTKSWDISVNGSAGSATSAKWLMNRGTNVTIGDSTWAHGVIGAGGTNTSGGTVWKQNWKQSGLTWDNNGTSTTLNNSGDMVIWLSQSSNSNNLWANLAIDGYIYSLSGFRGGGASNISINSATANSAIMTVKNTATGANGNFYWGYSHLMPNLATGGNLSGLSVGTAASDNNSAYFGWHHEGSSSANNYISIGTYGHNHLIKVYKTGNTVIAGTTTSTKFIGPLEGNADTATSISGQTPTLAASTESNEIVVKDLGNTAPESAKAQRKGIDFRWYDSHWMIGNLRTGSRPSAGFGFSYSADGTTYSNLVIISNEGKISATNGFEGDLTGNAASATGIIDAGNSSHTITIRYNGEGAAATDWIPMHDTSGNLVPVNSTNLANKIREKASGSWGISITGSSASCTGNATTASTASKLSNTSAIGSDVKPVYFTSGGVPQATATEMIRAFTTTSAGTDLNTYYDSGMYSITGGGVTNYPTGGSVYATLLTVAYRKPSGNTKPDYAWQMGNFTQDSDKMWYRTSIANSWRAWRQIVNIATNTAVGNSTTPVYVDANGAVQSCVAYSSASVSYATSAGSATTASNVTQSSSTAELARPIWFCYQENNSYILGRAGYNTNFMYNPGTKTITIGSGSLSETEYSGNAATATSASKISAKLATTTKIYLLGTATTITATAANVSLTGDTGIYLTTTAGELSAVRHSWNVSGTEKAYTVYNTTDDSLDFVFI